MPTALALADRLAANAPWAMTLTKQAIYAALYNDPEEQAILEERNQALLRHSLDAREGCARVRRTASALSFSVADPHLARLTPVATTRGQDRLG